MPALQPVSHVCQVSILGLLAGVASNNVIHVGASAGGGDFFSQADVDAIAVGVRAAYASHFLTGMSNQFTLGTVIAKDLTSDTAPQAFISGSTVGSVNATPLPSNVAMCISWAISRRYRGGHPRTYLSGLPDGQQSSPNTWSTTAITNFSNFAAGFMNDINTIAVGATGHAQLVTVHRMKNKIVLIPPTVDVITDSAIDSRLDSQRRRLGRDR